MAISPKSTFPADKARQTGAATLILPAAEPEQWETWKIDAGAFAPAGGPRLRPADFARTAFAWPSRDAITLPVWIAESGDAEKIVALELEARGLSRPGETPAFALDEVAREDDRRLVAVHLLRESGVPSPFPRARWCDAAVRWLAVESDALHFWQENGAICYALTRGRKVVYAESLRTAEADDACFRAIRRVIQRLQAEGVLQEKIAALVLFAPLPSSVQEHVRQAFALPLRTGEREPILPEALHDLPSSDIVTARRNLQTRGKIRMAAFGAIALLLALAITAGGRLAYEMAEIRSLEAGITAQSDEVNRLVGIARDWQVVETALNPQFYPLDILRDCAAQLPETGARFTAFSVNGPEVVIQGEAASHPAAFSFAESIKKSPALAPYAWDIPQPVMLPNNTASFQMRGTRRSE